MEEKTWKSHLWDWFKPFLFAVVLTIFFRNLIFLPMTIEGASMIPTFQQSDEIIVRTIYHINRFDLIVFKDDSNRILVKRVIGLPNETLHYKNDQLYINDVLIKEPFLDNSFVNKASGTWTSDFTLEEITGQVTIPEDEYFVLGDNRRSSNDSRYFGSISATDIIGETTMIYYPFKRLSFVQ